MNFPASQRIEIGQGNVKRTLKNSELMAIAVFRKYKKNTPFYLELWDLLEYFGNSLSMSCYGHHGQKQIF